MEGQRILIGTDLSENAKPAAKAAAELGAVLGVEVDVIHVLDLSLWRNRKVVDIWKDEALQKRVEERIGKWFEEAGGRAPDRIIVETGAPEHTIRKYAADEEIAALVLSMSGRGAWNRYVFGSTVLKLTSPPPAPMVVVHPEGAKFQKGMTLAVATDFSKAADVALQEAVWLAERFESPLHLVYANPLPSTTVITEEDLPEGMETTTVINEAEDSMEQYIDRHREILEDIDFEAAIIVDHPVAGLRSAVEDRGVDWMILGHRTSKERRGSSSIKSKWVQQMNCSTLLVPSHQNE